MFFINYKYGHQNIFEEYMGEKNIVIPGEIQHGYWNSPRWKSRIGNYPLLKTFLWGGSFVNTLSPRESKFVELIGDPYLYFLRMGTFNTPIRSESWLLIPRLSPSTSSIESSVSYHLSFLNSVIRTGKSVRHVTLHPSEKFYHQICKVYESSGISTITYMDAGPSEFYVKMTETYLRHCGIITNYVGPHIFRAEILNLQVSFSAEKEQINTSFHENNDSKTIQLLKEDSSARKELSIKELGVEHLRDVEELRFLFLEKQALFKRVYKGKVKLAKLRNLLSTGRDLIPIGTPERDYHCQHCFTRFENKLETKFRCIGCGRKLQSYMI